MVANRLISRPNIETVVRRPDGACGGPPCYAELIAYTIGDDGTGLEWIIPDSATTKARILVESLDNPYLQGASLTPTPSDPMATYGISLTDFIIRPSLTVSVPNTAINYNVNDTVNINWTTVGAVGNVKIDFSYDADDKIGK